MIETFTDILARRVSSSPDEGAFTFLADDGAPAAFTWSEVARRVDAVAARLRGLGLEIGRAHV